MMYKKLNSCLCCKNNNLFEILDLQVQPLANSFHTVEQKLTEYELKLMGCSNCWHTQLSIAVDPNELFKQYLYVSGTSKTLKDYFDWFAAKYTNSHGKKVLDIACNDGTQLDSFKNLNWDTYGVDPAVNLHNSSLNKGHKVICDFWNTDIAKTLPVFDLIIAQNVFAHTSKVDEFLEACKLVMNEETKLVIQTSQATMFENNEFDTIYHEHISFFSINSMKVLLERHGLYLENVSKQNIHGTSYLFEITKQKVNSSIVDTELNKETYRYNINFFNNYRDKAKECLYNLKEFTLNQNKKIIGYGAAAKGMTVINAGKIKLEYIIDDNPLKQNLLCPGSDIPVQNSSILYEEKNDLIIVPLAWNFYDEIVKKVKSIRPHNNDKFVRYFPKLEILE